MSRKSFNPTNWEQPFTAAPNSQTLAEQPPLSQQSNSDFEQLLSMVEQTHTDLTESYQNWLTVGFALADAFGENGREYYHCLSRFHSEYRPQNTDSQYNACLASKGHGVTLKSIFYLAKQKGLVLAVTNNEVEKEPNLSAEKETFTNNLPSNIYNKLPEFLQKVVARAHDNNEKDLLLLSAVTTISTCLPNIYGIYDDNKVYPNLYLFITAQASAGKGRIVHTKSLVNRIHQDLRKQSEEQYHKYQIELAEYNKNKHKVKDLVKPVKPPEKMLFIPANNSSTGAYQLLGDNNGQGIIFETEGDTLAHAFKSDYGNYSDGFRKAFHHETISYYRRTDREFKEITAPRLSCVLSGTPKQVTALIPNAENGLFSRFMFYYMDVKPEFKDVFASSSSQSLNDYFSELGQEFYQLYHALKQATPIQFSFTNAQQQTFVDSFRTLLKTAISEQGTDYLGTIRRLGIITFRFAMVLTALRIMETGDFPSNLICGQEDFETALTIIKTLNVHASTVFAQLPQEEIQKPLKNKKQRFLASLPHRFNREQYLSAARAMQIHPKTAEGYIAAFVKEKQLLHDCHNQYVKLNSK